MQYRRANESDYDPLVELQRANLATKLSVSEQKSEGFLSGYLDVPVLRECNHDGCVLVIAHHDEPIGFLAMHRPQFKLIPPLELAMLAVLNGMTVERKKFNEWQPCMCGPVCIAKEFRGQGLFEKLYEHVPEFAGDCDLVVTLISTDNQRSLAAHRKVGLKAINQFFWEGREFFVLVRPMRT